MREIGSQDIGSPDGVFGDERLERLDAVGAQQIADGDGGAASARRSDRFPQHQRIVEVVQHAVRHDAVERSGRQSRIGEMAPLESDAVVEVGRGDASLREREHRGPGVDGDERGVGIGASEAHRDIGGSAPEIEDGAGERTDRGEGVRHVGVVRNREVGVAVRGDLIGSVHQFGLGHTGEHADDGTVTAVIIDQFLLTDRVAIVTGAGKGIGAGCALALAEAGADVVLAARTPADLDAVAAEVRATGRRALTVPTDVTVTADLDALVAAAMAEFGRIDVLVNNAGGWMPRPFLATSERNFEAALRFNVTSAFLLSQRVVPHMVDAGGGSIVNISSRSASMMQPCFTAYAAAKAALSTLTRAMAPELAPKVRVNAIEVGGIETAALEAVLTDESVRTRLVDNTPMQRVGQPEDIAACVVYLASAASSFVTGKVFEVDGGVESPAFTIPFERL